MKKIWKLGLIFGIVAFMAGCSNLWDYQPPKSNSPKPTDQTPPPQLNQKTLTFRVIDGTGEEKSVTVQVPGTSNSVPIGQIKAAFKTQYPNSTIPEGWEEDGEWYESDLTQKATGNYSDGALFAIGLKPKQVGYTSSITTAGGGKREFLTDVTWGEETQTLSTILTKAGIAAGGDDKYKPDDVPDDWEFQGWATADAPTNILTPTDDTKYASGTNFVAVYNVPYKINIRGTDYEVTVPVTAPNTGATWEQILAAAKKDSMITTAAGRADLESLLWVNADGDDPAQLRGKQYPAGETFVQQDEINYNIKDLNGVTQSVSVKVPAGETTATWEQIKAAAKEKGIKLDAPSGYTGGGWTAASTLLANDTSVDPGNLITPDFTKDVFYTIVYDPQKTTEADRQRKATYTIKYPDTYAEKKLKDIFAAAKVDTNTAKTPTTAENAFFYLPPNSGKVFTGWTVTGKPEVFKPSEIDNNNRNGQALENVRSGAVITAKIDPLASSIPLGENGNPPFIDFTEIQINLPTADVGGDFYIQNTEITRGQWKAVMSKNGDGINWYLNNGAELWSKANTDSSGLNDDPNMPMTNVSWYEAIAFCNLLSKLKGKTPYYSLENGETDPTKWGNVPTKTSAYTHTPNSTWDNIQKDDRNKEGYRLPTGAQWEFAAKGGDNYGPYPSYSGTTGNQASDLQKVGWYSGHPQTGGRVHIVGELGGDYPVRDMSGNVWEWCWDKTREDKHANENPDGDQSKSTGKRLARGGGRKSSASQCTTGFENKGSPAEYSSIDFGFRIMYFKEN